MANTTSSFNLKNMHSPWITFLCKHTVRTKLNETEIIEHLSEQGSKLHSVTLSIKKLSQITYKSYTGKYLIKDQIKHPIQSMGKIKLLNIKGGCTNKVNSHVQVWPATVSRPYIPMDRFENSSCSHSTVGARSCMCRMRHCGLSEGL